MEERKNFYYRHRAADVPKTAETDLVDGKLTDLLCLLFQSFDFFLLHSAVFSFKKGEAVPVRLLPFLICVFQALSAVLPIC